MPCLEFNSRFWKLTCTSCGNFRSVRQFSHHVSKIGFQKVTQKSECILVKNKKMKVVTIINRCDTSIKHIFAEQYLKLNNNNMFNLINARDRDQKTTTADFTQACGILRRFDILCHAKTQ